METHILNGDAMTERMQAAGFENLVVARECLIEGPVQAATMDDFWHTRANFISSQFDDQHEQYYDHVVKEYDKLKQVPGDFGIHLWFGDDLFCQTNMWFIIEYLHELGIATNLYRVFPMILFENRWGDYGRHTPGDLRICYQHRVKFTDKDVELARNLWKAYKDDDFPTLKQLASTATNCFHDLEAVVQAHIDRFASPGRPEKVLQDIMSTGKTSFHEIFPEFWKREGIYGFGDTQVRNILEKMH